MHFIRNLLVLLLEIHLIKHYSLLPIRILYCKSEPSRESYPLYNVFFAVKSCFISSGNYSLAPSSWITYFKDGFILRIYRSIFPNNLLPIISCNVLLQFFEQCQNRSTSIVKLILYCFISKYLLYFCYCNFSKIRPMMAELTSKQSGAILIWYQWDNHK